MICLFTYDRSVLSAGAIGLSGNHKTRRRFERIVYWTKYKTRVCNISGNVIYFLRKATKLLSNYFQDVKVGSSVRVVVHKLNPNMSVQKSMPQSQLSGGTIIWSSASRTSLHLRLADRGHNSVGSDGQWCSCTLLAILYAVLVHLWALVHSEGGYNPKCPIYVQSGSDWAKKTDYGNKGTLFVWRAFYFFPVYVRVIIILTSSYVFYEYVTLI